MIKKTSIGLIVIMLFILMPRPMSLFKASQSASAASISPATLENIDGGVFVKKAGGIKELKGINGMEIGQGDTVRTDKEGSANLIFSTGSKMTAGPNTSFTVDRLKETEASGLKVSITLKAGTLWNSVEGLVNEEDEYEIVTASMAAQARGTLFMVSVDPTTGQSTTTVIEGSIRADSAAATRGPGLMNQGYLLQMGQTGTCLPPQRTPGSSIYNPQFPAAPPPPPPPQPIDTRSLVQNQAPSILANMAMDMVDRMQDIQRQNEALMASYQNTNNPAYLQSALQQSQANNLLAGLSQQYINAVQGSPQEQQMNQLLQQQNRSLDALRQQASQLQEQAQQMRDNTENAAQQAGLSPDEIQRLFQNAVSAMAASRSAPPIITPPAPPSPSPANNGASPGSGNAPDPNPNPGQEDDDDKPAVPISDFRSTGVSSTSAGFTWSVAQNPNNVRLQTSYDGQNWTNYIGNHTVAVTGSAITVNDLSPNTDYCFRIMVYEGNNRGPSNKLSITTDRLQITGISDITGTVRVGETLSAGMVTPENAIVTYQWQIAASADGTYEDIGGQTDSQYLVEANAVSKFIRVVATGTGDYTGTVISNPTDAVAEPIPINWLLPEPTVSFNTDGDIPQIIAEYRANQRGVVHYIVTDAYFVIEDDQDLIDFMTSDWEENDHVILRGSEVFSSENLERIEMAYSEGIYADMSYNLYMVLEGVNNTYSEVERLNFSTPKDVKPPSLTASVAINEATGELNVRHLVEDYDEFYNLYVWVIPKDYPLNGEPTAQEVKDAGRAAQNEYLSLASGVEDVKGISIPNLQPDTEYIIYLVVQDQSDAGENEESLFSEVRQFSVTTPSPATA